MAKKKKTDRYIKTIADEREKFFNYVYDKYVYNIFIDQNMDMVFKMQMAYEKYSKDPSKYIDYYIKDNNLSSQKKDMAQQFKQGIIGEFYIIKIENGQVLLYDVHSNKIYDVIITCPQDIKVMGYLKNNFVSLETTILPYNHKYYMDFYSREKPDYDNILPYDLERDYETMRSALHNDFNGTIYSTRSLKTDSLSNIFIDFINPLRPFMYYDQNIAYKSVEVALKVWNNGDQEDSDAYRFFMERKKHYFSQINKSVKGCQVNPEPFNLTLKVTEE